MCHSLPGFKCSTVSKHTKSRHWEVRPPFCNLVFLRTARPIVIRLYTCSQSCDSLLFRWMKELNKCSPFHQSQSSTSRCHSLQYSTPYFPSIFPQGRFRLQKYTSKTLFYVKKGWCWINALKKGKLFSDFVVQLTKQLSQAERARRGLEAGKMDELSRHFTRHTSTTLG